MKMIPFVLVLLAACGSTEPSVEQPDASEDAGGEVDASADRDIENEEPPPVQP